MRPDVSSLRRRPRASLTLSAGMASVLFIGAVVIAVAARASDASISGAAPAAARSVCATDGATTSLLIGVGVGGGCIGVGLTILLMLIARRGRLVSIDPK